MSEQRKTISREELYERLWKVPINRLTVELGYSYVELVKICSALNIPRPKAGHWYWLQHGGTPEQVPLPPAAEGIDTNIPFGPRLHSEKRAESAASVGGPPEAPPTTASVARQSNELGGDEDSRETVRVSRSETAPEGRGPAADSDTRRAPVRVAPAFPDEVEMTRAELYNHVWTTPIHLLSEALGLSDVGLAKTCAQMEVPKPGRGYWARLYAGEPVEQTPLPAASTEAARKWTFNVAANRRRRSDWATTNVSTPIKSNSTLPIELPGDAEPLHEIAERHRSALERAKPDSNGFVHLDTHSAFQCDVSVSTVPKLVRAIHALVVQLEKRNRRLVRGDGCLSVAQGQDRITMHWREAIVEFEREPTMEEKRKPSWTWQLKEKRATGQLTVEVAATGLRGQRSWTESENKPIEEVLARVMEKIAAAFEGLEAQRQREAERERQRIEYEKQQAELRAVREQEWKEQQRNSEHQKKLQEMARIRRFNLGVAAQQWEDSQRVLAFIDAVEKRWRGEPPVELAAAQKQWLDWARTEANQLAPWSTGYPDPESARRCDPNAIPVGGEYPDMTRLKPHEFRLLEPRPEASPYSQYYGSR